MASLLGGARLLSWTVRERRRFMRRPWIKGGRGKWEFAGCVAPTLGSVMAARPFPRPQLDSLETVPGVLQLGT